MSEEWILFVIPQVAQNYQTGDVIAETGGVRKLRVALPGQGKRGGARVVYIYYSDDMPVFLLTCYGKNSKADLSATEKKELKKLAPLLRQAYLAGLRDRVKTEPEGKAVHFGEEREKGT